MLWQNFKLALVSIKSAKLRSFLTMLGVIIGVAAVLTMVSIGDGVKKQVSSQISDLGTNVLTVASGQIGGSGGSGGGQRSGFGFAGTLGTSTLTAKDLESVKNTEHIIAAAPIEILSGVVVRGGQTAPQANVVATTTEYSEVRNIDITSGHFLSHADDEKANYVVVLGANVKSSLFGESDAMGEKVSIRNQEFEVIGVIKKSDEEGLSSAGSNDDIVYIPSSAAAKLTGTSQIFRIISRVDESENVAATKEELQRVIKENHGGQADFSVLTQEDLLGTINSILDILTTFVAAIASISLLVGGIGIMNIMLVSVTERTREIGIRKAIGATFGNILSQFLIEAVMLSLLGGLLGLLLSFGGSFVVKQLANITPVFSLKAIALAFGVSVTIGIVFGVAPAIKAARKRPIQALKAL